MEMEKNLNEIYDGLKGDYYVNESGEVYRKKNDYIQFIRPNPQNRNDKHIAVHLAVCSGREIINKHFPVRYVVLNAFKGYRGREYKCGFLDGNVRNVHNSNLFWMMKDLKGLSLFDILSDNELKIWEEVLKNIKDIVEIRNQHESWLRRYIEWDQQTVIFNKAEYYTTRREFFKKMFNEI